MHLCMYICTYIYRTRLQVRKRLLRCHADKVGAVGYFGAQILLQNVGILADRLHIYLYIY